eukprot:13775507-Alexandrium_andersonii.AAC.1
MVVALASGSCGPNSRWLHTSYSHGKSSPAACLWYKALTRSTGCQSSGKKKRPSVNGNGPSDGE